jgi:hypothetical protein
VFTSDARHGRSVTEEVLEFRSVPSYSGVGDSVGLRFAPRIVAAPAILGIVFVVSLAARGNWGWSMTLAIVFGACYGGVFERRLDFDVDGLTLTPMLPIRPRQRFPWRETGSPRFGAGYGGYGKIKVPLCDRRYFFAGVFPRKSIDLTAVYELAPGRERLGAPFRNDA